MKLASDKQLAVRWKKGQSGNLKGRPKAIMTTKERLELLSAIARMNLKRGNPVEAIKEQNRMEGIYPPERHEITTDVVHTVVFVLPDGSIVKPQELSGMRALEKEV